jgi:hypothetical protein
VDVAPSVSHDGRQRIADFVLAPAELDSLEFVERAKTFNPARDERLLRRSLLHNLRQLPKGARSTTAAISPRRSSRTPAPACRR